MVLTNRQMSLSDNKAYDSFLLKRLNLGNGKILEHLFIVL